MPKKLTCLLIEDNPADVDYIQERLSELGAAPFDLLAENNLSAGIRRAEQDRSINVVLLDLSLPDSRGLATAVRMLEAQPLLPVVILTGSDDKVLWKQALEAGAQDYLVKSDITADTLVRSLNYAIVRKRLLDEMAERERRLKELDAMKTDFIHMINHELTTPISTIVESLGILEKSRSDQRPPDEQELLDMARRNADRLFRLTSDLIDLTRLGSGQFDLRPERSDLRKLAETACRSVEVSAKCKIHLIGPKRKDPLVASIDPQRMEQVLVNLLKNAARFCRSQITVGIEEIEDGFRLIVEDDGPGIDPADLPRIFDKFYRGKPSARGKAGSGLGLAIVKGIVEAHGGDVTAESRPGAVGARLIVRLPRSQKHTT